MTFSSGEDTAAFSNPSPTNIPTRGMTPTTTSPNITPEQIIEHIQTKGQLSLTPWQIELIHRLRTDPVMGTAITARPAMMRLIQKAIKAAIRDISAGRGTKK